MVDYPKPEELNAREQLIRIDQMIIDIQRTMADRDRKRQEYRYQPLIAVMSGMTAGAAIVAATVAFLKIIGGAP